MTLELAAGEAVAEGRFGDWVGVADSDLDLDGVADGVVDDVTDRVEEGESEAPRLLLGVAEGVLDAVTERLGVALGLREMLEEGEAIGSQALWSWLGTVPGPHWVQGTVEPVDTEVALQATHSPLAAPSCTLPDVPR